MQRVLLITPVAFVVLAALGFHNAVSGMLSPPVAAKGGAAAVAAAPPVAAATRAVGQLVPVATDLPVAPTAATPVQIRAVLVPTATPDPSPTPLPPTVTPVPTDTPRPSATPKPTALAPHRISQEAPPRVTARSYVVVDGDSGEILAELNPHLHVAPASTTKIITTLVALQHNNLDEMVTAQYDPSELVDSTLMGLHPGDQLTLEDLLYGLMLPSGNDAALAIATYVAGSKAAFVERMNQLTADLGLSDSHWVNPHGLDAPGHYSSAYDMVQFARVGMQDPRFQALAAARSHTVHVGSRTYEVYNLNRVLPNVPGADGVKIGYTDDAGRTIVASVTRNGHRVYVGAFHIGDLVIDTKPLFEWAFRVWAWN